MEDTYALHISIVAADILKREIGILVVLPEEGASELSGSLYCKASVVPRAV